MATISNPAVVLRYVDTRESDRVVTLFTRDHGRIVGLARGVRRSMKRFAGRLDLFSFVEIHYRPGRGELLHLEGSTLLSANLGIRGDLYRIAWAAYFSELVEKLYGEGEPHPAGYEVLVAAISYLAHVPEPHEGHLRVFELKLLEEAGLQPELEACVSCRRPVGPEVRFSFVVTRGGPVCERCAPVEGGQPVAAEALGRLAQGVALPVEELWQLTFTDAEIQGMRDLMRVFLRFHVGGTLKSAAFLVGLEPSVAR